MFSFLHVRENVLPNVGDQTCLRTDRTFNL